MAEQSQTSEVMKTETGWDRVKGIFSTNEFGDLSPEVDSVIQAGCAGMFFGSIIGGFTTSREAYLKFIENNQATVFRTHFEAKKALQDKVTLAIFKGGYRVGWRLGVFSSSFVLFSTVVSTYRQKTSVLEYAAGGALAGMIYRMQMGFRASFAGFVIGAGLGAISGLVPLGAMKLTNTTAQDMARWKQEYVTTQHTKRKEQIEAERQELSKKISPVIDPSTQI